MTDTMITRRHQDDSLTPSPTKVGALAGRAADEAAARSAFVDYRSKRAANTLRRQNADLAHFARYLVEAMAARH